MPEPDTPMAVPNASPTNSNQQHHKKHTVPLVYSPRSMSPPHMVTRHPGGSYSSPHLYSSPHPYHRHATSYVSSIPYPVSPPTHTSARSFEAAIPMVEGDPPEASHQDKARKATTAAERSRAATLEAQEVTLTADAVRIILRQERRRAAKLAADLAAHKASAVQLQLAAEVCEEGRINGLMRQVDNLTHEKERVIVELEREEEMVGGGQRLVGSV